MRPQWQPDGSNRCPACTGTHWEVGGISAECVRCGTVLPFAPPTVYPLLVRGRAGSGRFDIVRRVTV